MNKGFAYANFERSGLRKLRAEKLEVGNLVDTGLSRATPPSNGLVHSP